MDICCAREHLRMTVSYEGARIANFDQNFGKIKKILTIHTTSIQYLASTVQSFSYFNWN